MLRTDPEVADARNENILERLETGNVNGCSDQARTHDLGIQEIFPRPLYVRIHVPLTFQGVANALPLSCNCGNIAANTGTFAIAALAGFPSATHAAEI
jgi:hypothetical protein